MGNESAESSAREEQPSDPGKELFQIIDETGEGFGFELTPEVLIRPLAIGGGALFGVGMLAGIPFGIAMGRAQESDSKSIKGGKARPTLDGVKFAATTFGLGTILCGAIGVAGFYGLKWYYQAETFEDFGKAMKQAVPIRRQEIESGLRPVLDRVRSSAGMALPGPMRRMQERFHESRLGTWLKDQVALSVVPPEEGNPHSNAVQHHSEASASDTKNQGSINT